MINKLTLKNFKKVEDSTIEFTAGLNAVKGANEQGKSTRFLGIMYALFGSRALPMSLADTVTYGKPESALFVELEFTYEGVTYNITRGKSGAQLTYAGGNSQGQTEVTRYVEQLFGINADVASKLMVASQNNLRGALEGGGAISLIESLSNLGLIDQLISKIQDQLPCGNTKTLVEMIDAIADTPEPALDLGTLPQQHEEAARKCEEIQLDIGETLKMAAKYDRRLLTQDINTVNAAITRKAHLEKELENLQKLVAVKPDSSTIDVETLVAKRNEQNLGVAALFAYDTWKNYEQPEPITVTGDLAGLIQSHKEAIAVNNKLIRKSEMELVNLKASRINEQECGLCGKLLQDVPEVVAKNLVIDRFLEEELEQIRALQEEVDSLNAYLKKLEQAKFRDSASELMQARLSNYCSLSSTVPRTVLWTAPKPVEVEPTDYDSMISEARSSNLRTAQAVAVYEERLSTLAALQARYDTVVIDLAAKYKAEQQLRELDDLLEVTSELKINHTAAAGERDKLLQEIGKLRLVYEHTLSNWQNDRDHKATLQASLKEYQRNNALIKKLRDVRPIVASRLWAIVLTSVSTYFSQIRGTQSTVTRNESTFLVDGKPIAGLSGSTLDSLGLAVRMALGKTFLPSINFLLLDEPSAGMDEEREAAMLGLLAASAYEQVIVVTHSNLADSFAATVISL